MSRTIDFEIGGEHFAAVLHDTPAADTVWEALPLEADFSTWGDEIYFSTGIHIHGGADRETVDLGDVGFWPPGQALCLFYGPTPMSGPGEIRPASEVAVIGRLEGDPQRLKSVRGRRVSVRRLSSDEP
jgi:hypothetical protein